MKLLGSEGLMIGQEILAVHRQLLFLTALMPGNVACSTKQKVKVGILRHCAHSSARTVYMHVPGSGHDTIAA